MPTGALQAHFDGSQIVLDEPCELPLHAPLMITVLPTPAETDSEETWLRSAAGSDAFDFLADSAEDIYTTEDGEPFRDETPGGARSLPI